MDVLDQGIAQEILVVGVAQHDGDGGEARRLRRSQAPLPRDQLVAAVVRPPHDERLQDPDLSDRRGECRERLVVEVGPGLLRVRRDRVDRHIDEPAWRRHPASGAPGISADSPRPRPPRLDIIRLPCGTAATGASARSFVVVQRRPDRLGSFARTDPPPGARPIGPPGGPIDRRFLVDHDDAPLGERPGGRRRHRPDPVGGLGLRSQISSSASGSVGAGARARLRRAARTLQPSSCGPRLRRRPRERRPGRPPRRPGRAFGVRGARVFGRLGASADDLLRLGRLGGYVLRGPVCRLVGHVGLVALVLGDRGRDGAGEVRDVTVGRSSNDGIGLSGGGRSATSRARCR